MNKRDNSHIVDYGGKGDVIILLHGFVSASRYWKNLQPLLSIAGYRVITIDLLGFGNADKPANAEYTYEEHIAHINDAIENLRLPNRFVLVGHSMGALLAARYCILYKSKVQSLILLHPPLYIDREQVRKTLRNTGIFYRALLDSRYRQSLWILLRTIGIVGEHSQTSREKTMQNIIERAEIFDDLLHVQIKTLLLVGSKDRKEYLANLSTYSLPDQVTVMIESVAHHSPRKQPEMVRDNIIDFIQ